MHAYYVQEKLRVLISDGYYNGKIWWGGVPQYDNGKISASAMTLCVPFWVMWRNYMHTCLLTVSCIVQDSYTKFKMVLLAELVSMEGNEAKPPIKMTAEKEANKVIHTIDD